MEIYPFTMEMIRGEELGPESPSTSVGARLWTSGWRPPHSCILVQVPGRGPAGDLGGRSWAALLPGGRRLTASTPHTWRGSSQLLFICLIIFTSGAVCAETKTDLMG